MKCNMPGMTPTVWTARRKWLGNLAPLLVWLPFAIGGFAWMAIRRSTIGPGLLLLILATVLGWVALNQFGLFENARMKAQLKRILASRGEALPDVDRWFVGFASPKYAALLDAHEDVGFFTISPDRLLFASETRTIEIAKGDVRRIRFRPNVHSMVGLGRWICIEGTIGSKPIRLNIEPRERRTLLGNLREGKRLLARLAKWQSET